MKRHHSRRGARAVVGLLALLATQVCTADPLVHRPIEKAWPRPLAASGPTTPAEMEAFLDGFMTLQLRSAPAAGVTVSVVKEGQLFFAKGYGYADPDKGVPVDAEKTLFRPGSISKTFTWTAVMQLVEQGKLNLDADVNTYLRDFKLPATYAAPVTLRNLMTHTPGFEEGGAGYMFRASAGELVSLDQLLRQHVPARVRPPTTDFNSGTNASYSNWGTALAGRIVEIVSGQSFDEYIEQHIFAPLGMTHSTFREPVPANLISDVSGGFEFEGGKFERQGFEYIHGIGPAGSLSSTATDMAKFMMAHLQGSNGQGRILKPETEQLMQTRTMSPDPALNGQLLGFYETWINGRRILGHGGDTQHFHSEMALLPEQNLGLFVSVNTGGEAAATATKLQRAFFEHYFPAALPKVTPPADANTRNERYTGTYRTLRNSYTKFEKALVLAGEDSQVEAMPDGTLLMKDSEDDKPARWVEVGEGVFRRADVDDFVAFKDIKDGHATALVGSFPAIASARIAWYERTTLHWWVLGLCIVMFVVTVIGTLRKWRTYRADAAGLRWARPTLALTALLLLAFVCSLAISMASGLLEGLIYRIPASLYVALTFPLLALVPLAASIYFAVKLWTSGAWKLRQRLSYTATTLAAVIFVLILNYWNLVGYRIG